MTSRVSTKMKLGKSSCAAFVILLVGLCIASCQPEKSKPVEAAETEETWLRGVVAEGADWPHRYRLQHTPQGYRVWVEQRGNLGEDEWFVWPEVKVVEQDAGKVFFVCPWGVIGKLLHAGCEIEFDDATRRQGIVRIFMSGDRESVPEYTHRVQFEPWSVRQQNALKNTLTLDEFRE